MKYNMIKYFSKTKIQYNEIANQNKNKRTYNT